MSCIRDPVARDLIRKLLARDPSKRPSAREVLMHPFLRPPEDIQRDMDKLKAQLEEAEKAAASAASEASKTGWLQHFVHVSTQELFLLC